MSDTCPGGAGHQVWKLKEYWKQMAQDAERKAELAPPADVERNYVTAAVLIVGGLLALSLGSSGIVLGLLLIAAGMGVGAYVYRNIAAAQAARAAWEADHYCVTCSRRLGNIETL